MSGPSSLAIDSPAQASAEWATGVLRHAGHDATVSSIEVAAVGNGMVGDTYRFELDLSEADDATPRSFVGKFPAADPGTRESGFQHLLYQREVGFYTDLVSTVGVRTAEPLFAYIDEPGKTFTLVLEDLSPARAGNQLEGCTVEEAGMAMDQAAALHAPRWGDPSLRDLPWLNITELMNDSTIKVIQAVHEGFRERFTGRIEEQHLDVCDHMALNIARYFERQSSMSHTIHHADFRLDNILWDAKGGGVPMALVDWQTVLPGPGPLDVAYFLGSGLTIDDRRANERELVQRYHTALQAGGVTDLTFEQCWDGYRLFSYSGLIMAIGPAMLVAQTDRGDEMFITLATRHAQQALDLDAAALLTA